MAVGSGPVLAYATAVAVSTSDREAFLSRATHEITKAEAAGGFVPPVLDGYDLVRRMALDEKVDPEAIDAAYRSSRSLLGTERAPIAVPEGFHEFLAALSRLPGVRVCLVTNAPETNLLSTLEQLGLTGSFDRVHAGAGKPDGLTPLAEQWLAEGRVLSVGDIWRNDLEPVHALGGDTALIGIPAEDAEPTFAATTFPELYPSILRWARAGEKTSPSPQTHEPHETESLRS